MDYKQPDFYHFSRDSIILAGLVAQDILERNSSDEIRLLDIGCGCGVIGLEVAKRIRDQRALHVHLLEKQKEFYPFIEDNIKHFLPDGVDCQIEREDFLNFRSDQSFTHIVCNPPYFREGLGRPSSKPLRKTCRSWTETEAQDFMKKIVKLCRDDKACAFLSGREELSVDHEVLDKLGATSFYRLF